MTPNSHIALFRASVLFIFGALFARIPRTDRRACRRANSGKLFYFDFAKRANCIFAIRIARLTVH